MNMPFSPTAPAKLYAFLLKLRPLRQGTLMPFSGELVHGAWLHWLKAATPDVATWLHEGNKLRSFTCSSLQFPLPVQRMVQAEREHVHLPLDPEKTYTIRTTLLHGELFPLVYDALMRSDTMEAKQTPFMQIGKQLFALEEIVIDNDDPSGWTGFTSLTTLVEKARELRLASTESLSLEFASLTTFNRSNTRNGYGLHFACLLLPQYVFPGLARPGTA